MLKDNPSSQQTGGDHRTNAAASAFPIVGIGASAGGLEALKQLFAAMPAEPGLAFVVIQHLDPTKQSLLSELLDKQTALEVATVDDNPQVVPNRVYVIPPNKYLSISDGKLQLSEPEQPRGSRMAIDHFLRSLANDQKQRAVAIILSGTGSDGSLGVKSIKAQGGFVLAQDPQTASHAGMPRGAINTKLVDSVLVPEAMAEALVKFAEHPYIRESIFNATDEEASPVEKQATASTENKDDLNSILSLLRSRTQLDFNNYKEKTLFRRTRRRMCLHHFNDFSEYHEYLRENPAEVESLRRDLLIAVTDFFRDPEAWQVLEEEILPGIVASKENGDPIRAWIPGCATGEEPYSLAILLMEALRQAEKDCPLQIFASDIDKEGLAQARAGRYPSSIAADVSPERLKRFFSHTKEDGHHYYVSKPLREAVVFAEQNLIADPPFSKLDIICCRNLLIYLKPEVQEKLIRLFHFALGEGGILFLGNSETIGRHSELYETVDKRWRIFRRIGSTKATQVEFPVAKGSEKRHTLPTQPTGTQLQSRSRLTHLADQQLLDLLAPAAVVVNRDWQILYIAGDVDDFLTHSPGVPNDDLLQKCRRGLRSKTRGAVQRALDAQATVTVAARVLREGKYHDMRLIVRPFTPRDEEQELALVVFESGDGRRLQEKENSTSDSSEPESSNGQAIETDIDGDSVVRQLEDELAATKEDLQQTLEQSETSQEELKASNEEVMSINEELQSTNEELETSKEELESLNEELSTVNNQLSGKVEELETKHADLENLLAATDVATICLDRDLHIRWFTPAATRLFRLGSSDHGRLISDLSHDFCENDLENVAQHVFDKLTLVETEVTTEDDRHFLRRVTPYRSEDDRISGVVITFVDISSRKRAEIELQHAKQLSDTIIESAPLPLLALDKKLRVQRTNQAFYERFQVNPEKTVGRLVYELGNGQWDIPQLRELLERILPERETFENFEVQHDFESIGSHTMLLSARRIDHLELILLAIEDITERRAEEVALRESEQRLRMAAKAARFGAYSFDYVADESQWSTELYNIYGLPEGEPINHQRLVDLMHPADRERFVEHTERAKAAPAGTDYEGEFRIHRPDGEVRWISDHGRMVFASHDEAGRPLRAVGMVVDITKQKQTESALATLNQSLEKQVEERVQMLSILQDAAIASNETNTPEEAIQAILQRICDFNHWVIGHAYRPDPANPHRILSTGIWYINSKHCLESRHWEQYEEFRERSDATSYARGEGVIGRVLESGEPAWVEEVSEFDELEVDPRPYGLFALIAFPVQIDGEVVAVLECLSDRPIEQEPMFMEIMLNVGIQLGHVIERNRLELQIAQSSEREQRRIGSDMHDGIGQELSGLRYLAQTHAESLAEAASPELKVAERITEGLGIIQQQLRIIIRDLIPVEIDKLGLATALQALAQRTREAHSIECSFTCDSTIVLEDNLMATQLFRIAQEAVSNAVAHAQAKRISIQLVRSNGQLELKVSDDGVGFDPKSQHDDGFGLRSMAYRARLSGAQLKIQEAPQGGTLITCKLRLP